MRQTSGWALLGLGATATVGMLVAALEVSVAAIPMTRGVDPASVNRAFKSDRLSALPGAGRVMPRQQTIEPKLPDGCIAEAEWRGNAYTEEVAGRCVA